MRTGCWHSFSAVSGAFSGLIAFGIQHAHTALANWKLLFIIEGIPTILLGICAMIILPSRPEDARIFNEKERDIAFERRNRGRKGDVGRVVNKGTHLKAWIHRPSSCSICSAVAQPTSSLHSQTGRYVMTEWLCYITYSLFIAGLLRCSRPLCGRLCHWHYHRVPTHYHQDLRFQ